MNQNSTDEPRLWRTSLGVDLAGDETATHIATLGDGRVQAQIGDPDYTWKFHGAGTPEAWRHLAKQIEDLAMEGERLLAEEARKAERQAVLEARKVSPLGDRRERKVMCSRLGCRQQTENLVGTCDDCLDNETPFGRHAVDPSGFVIDPSEVQV